MGKLNGISIAVDFDGTIVDHCFPDIGQPVPGAFEWLIRFKEEGARIFLWTMRSNHGKDGYVLNDAVNYCWDKGLAFDCVNCNPEQSSWTNSPKLYATYYIDDAAVGCPLKVNPRAGGRKYVDWEKIGPLVMNILVVHGIEFPRVCPDNCPMKGQDFSQSSLCTRCPIFCCTGDLIMDSSMYRPDWAIEWKVWFDSNCQSSPDLLLEK